MRLAGDPPDVHITPRIGHIGWLDFHRAAAAATYCDGETRAQVVWHASCWLEQLLKHD